MPDGRRRIELEPHELLDALEAIAEQEPGPLDRAEEIAEHREAAAADAREEERRPARRTHAPLDLRHFEPRVDFGGRFAPVGHAVRGRRRIGAEFGSPFATKLFDRITGSAGFTG